MFLKVKISSTSEFEDEDNSDISVIIGGDKENYDSDEEISDILLDSDKQVTPSIILIRDSGSCISYVLFKTTCYMDKFLK